MKQPGLTVARVNPGSIASQLGIEPGDCVTMINNQPVRDIIDYRFLTSDEKLTLLLSKIGTDSTREYWILDIEKDCEEDLGIDFAHSGLEQVMRCQNQCIFCFVDQMPAGMRDTLYVKDDDYRLSFLQGNFITLTNLCYRDLERIARQHLSPLYISVHTTDQDLRKKMLNHPRAGKITEQLSFLAQAKIEMHTQVVLCPDINDGVKLVETIKDLSSLWPAIRSLAVVPVGLTRYREGLYPLRLFTPAEAKEVVSFVEKWQHTFIKRHGYPLVFASDEFYLLAGVGIPPAEYYADFPQTENGVGLARIFLDQSSEVYENIPSSLDGPRKVTVVTGLLGEQILAPLIKRLKQVKKLEITLSPVVNRFFGSGVTVAGLLTGQDLLDQLNGEVNTDLLIIPEVMLHPDELIFLDNVKVQEFACRLGVPVAIAREARELVAAVVSETVPGIKYFYP